MRLGQVSDATNLPLAIGGALLIQKITESEEANVVDIAFGDAGNSLFKCRGVEFGFAPPRYLPTNARGNFVTVWVS